MYLHILTELVIGYVALYILVKMTGKSQLSQITPFDFISALVLGDLVGGAVFEQKAMIPEILFAILVWGVLIYATELITQKSRKLRDLLEGKPVMIINKGKLDWSVLKKNKIDLNQLLEMLRLKNVFSLRDVEYAILENNGSISILKKTEAALPVIRDFKMKVEERALPTVLISDGEIIEENLKEVGLDKEWLIQQLKQKGNLVPKNISYAEYEPGKDLYIQKYNNL